MGKLSPIVSRQIDMLTDDLSLTCHGADVGIVAVALARVLSSALMNIPDGHRDVAFDAFVVLARNNLLLGEKGQKVEEAWNSIQPRSK
jgi:hypothetical protein